MMGFLSKCNDNDYVNCRAPPNTFRPIQSSNQVTSPNITCVTVTSPGDTSSSGKFGVFLNFLLNTPFLGLNTVNSYVTSPPPRKPKLGLAFGLLYY